MWRDIPRSETVFPVYRARRQDLLIGDSNRQGSTRCAAAGGEIEQPMREIDACWGRSGGRRGSMAGEEGDVLVYCVAAISAACEAGSNVATVSGEGSCIAGSGFRYPKVVTLNASFTLPMVRVAVVVVL